MAIDLRLPMGLMFTILGLILAGYGMLALGGGRPDELSSGINVNLWWGLVILAFGVLMLSLALMNRRSRNKTKRNALEVKSA